MTTYFWADHLTENGESLDCKRMLADDGEVFNFLREKLLHWLEGLSHLGKLSDGIQAIRKLLSIAQGSGASSHQLAEFLQDADKFLRSHAPIIERAPMRAYGSALAFSPTASKVRSALWRHRLPFIQNSAGMKSDWDAHLQTLEGHGGWVRAVAFSPDGQTLASASDDKTVRLWDAATGSHRRTLKGHGGWARAVAFSPDGKYLITNYGLLRLSSAPSLSEQCSVKNPSDYALYVKNEWITLDGVERLWLPPDCRATEVALYGNTMVLGHKSGGLTFLKVKFASGFAMDFGTI